MAVPSSTSSSNARPLRPYAWALAIVVAIDIACRFLLPHGSLELVFDDLRARVEQHAPPSVQIVGDSVAAGAIMDSIVNTERMVVRNDAVMGTSPAFTYFLVREELERGHRPQALIFAHHPRLFAKSSVNSLVGLFAHWSELPDVLTSDHGLDRRNVEFALLTRVSYLLAYRSQLRELITGETPSFIIPGAGVPQRTRLADYMAAVSANRFQPKPLEQSLPDAYRVPFTASPENDEFFRKLVALVDEHDIDMYWLSIPVPQRVAEQRRQLGYDRQIEAYLQPFVESGAVSYLNRSSAVYPDDEFDDYSHLNMRGAVHFSCELRTLLREKTASNAGVSIVPVVALSTSDQDICSSAQMTE